MNRDNAPLTPDQRLGRLEDPVRDFPFYIGSPAALSGGQWLLLMGAVVLGFALLVLPISWPGGAWGAWIPALLFPAVPLLVLARMAPDHWHVLFGQVRARELRLMLGFALLNVVVSMGVGAVVRTMSEVTPNAAAALLANMDGLERVAFMAKMAPQLLGEELITLLPFLALLHLFCFRFGAGRRASLVAAWLVSSLVFGLIHLPTYQWNWVQCIVVIGSARLVLTLPWILTKNLWVSTGAHIVNDWLLFGLGLLGASLAAKA